MEERNEEPSPRKLRRARARGEVAVSPLFTSALVVAATTVTLGWEAPRIFASWRSLARALLTSSLPAADALALAGATAARSLLWPLAAAVAAGALGSLVQVGPLFAPRALAPDFGRLNPRRGLARIVSKDELIARFGAFVLAVVLFAIGAQVLLAALPALAGRIERAPFVLGSGARALEAFLVRVSIALLLAGVIAWVYRRTRFRVAQRMSRREVQEELREEEGDPAMRRRREERQRTLVPVGDESLSGVALVVHGAQRTIAVRWARDSDEPPRIAAIERGASASRLAARARAENIPIAHDALLTSELERLAAGRTLRRYALRRLARHLATHPQTPRSKNRR